MECKFVHAFSADEVVSHPALHDFVNKSALMTRLQQLCGIALTQEAQQAFENDTTSFCMVVSDLSELKPVVKQMNISLLSTAISLAIQAELQNAPRLFRYTSQQNVRDILTIVDWRRRSLLRQALCLWTRLFM